MSNDEAVVCDNIIGLLSDFYKSSGLFGKDCLAVCIGAAGVSGKRAFDGLYRILSNLLPQSRVIVTDDCSSALYGGTLTGCGIVLISGTGSICYGKNMEGNSHRTGGWGHIIGDEGSAYDIAVNSLSAVAKSYDGRNAETVLTKLIYDYLNISTHRELIDFCYRAENTKADIAKLAFLCDKACAAGDIVAKIIIEEAADKLIQMTVVVAEKLGISSKSFDCVYAGGCIINSDFLKTSFCDKLYSRLPNVSIGKGKADAAYGCILIAFEKCGMIIK